MKRWARRLFATIAAWAILSPVYAASPIESALDSVVALDIRVEGGGQQCSGFVYAPGRVMTAAHCTHGGVFYLVRFFDGTAARAQLIGQSPADDVAILLVLGHPTQPLRLSTKPLQPGDTVIAIGHPVGYEWSATSGIVSRVLPKGSWYGSWGSSATLIQHDASIARGSSGGPLLNTRGEVVGINVGGDRRVQFVSLAVSIVHAIKVVEGFGK